MNRIVQKFHELKTKRQTAFMPYLAAGDPNLETTLKLVLAFEQAGADIIELGIPFSDPVADGPTIQAASQRALAGGVTLRKIFRLVQEIRGQSQIPLNFMSYYNPIYHYGLENFIDKMAELGVDGLIVPDLPYEEAGPLQKLAEARNICLISFVAPTSNAHRIKKIVAEATGFIYLVSLTGVTGARSQLNEELDVLIKNLRGYTQLPICVGFGVANTEQAHAVARIADGVIVGSAIINELSKHLGQPDLVEKTTALVREMSQAVKQI